MNENVLLKYLNNSTYQPELFNEDEFYGMIDEYLNKLIDVNLQQPEVAEQKLKATFNKVNLHLRKVEDRIKDYDKQINKFLAGRTQLPENDLEKLGNLEELKDQFINKTYAIHNCFYTFLDFATTNFPNVDLRINNKLFDKFLPPDHWINLKIKEEKGAKELGIVMDIIGYSQLINNKLEYEYNSKETKQPVFHYIPEVLERHNLTSDKAYKLVLKYRDPGPLHPSWHKNVIPHILDYLKNYVPQQKNNSTLEIPSIDTETPNFVNNFDNISPTKIYNHFKAGLVEKGYLTEHELIEYLKAAFELQTIPKTLFKLKHRPSNQKIYIVFYKYYRDISDRKHSTQIRYVELLGNYFTGYNSNTIRTNWSRKYTEKR